MKEYSFNDDAGDFLLAQLAKSGSSTKLRQAARTAGHQLELLKPSVMGMTRDGFYGGPAAMVPVDAMVVMLARGKKVATIQMMANVPVAELFADMREASRELFPDTGTDPEAWMKRMPPAMHFIIDQIGSVPGTNSPKGSDNAIHAALGTLLNVLGDERVGWVADWVQRCSEATICPALIGMIGRASSGTPGLCSVAWPMTLPLARYVDAVMPAEGD